MNSKIIDASAGNDFKDNESIQEKIDRFKAFNLEAIQIATSMANNEEFVHKKVLLFSIIDSLATAASNEKHNNARFISSVREYSCWTDVDRISLLHLLRWIEKINRAEFNQLADYVKNTMIESYPSQVGLLKSEKPISVDSSIEEIREKWPRDCHGKELETDRIKIEKFTHGNLLYQYRNSVVHEFRNPGKSCEIFSKGKNMPYYQTVAAISPSVYECIELSYRFELVYPIDFICKIAFSMLDKMCEWFVSQNSSPFKNYSNGSYWMPSLNSD